MEKIYPCTIVHDRYCGSYSGGKWTAWQIEFNNIPDAINSDDITCDDFWEIESECYFIGKGNTPMEAYTDLCRKLKE